MLYKAINKFQGSRCNSKSPAFVLSSLCILLFTLPFNPLRHSLTAWVQCHELSCAFLSSHLCLLLLHVDLTPWSYSHWWPSSVPTFTPLAGDLIYHYCFAQPQGLKYTFLFQIPKPFFDLCIFLPTLSLYQKIQQKFENTQAYSTLSLGTSSSVEFA